MLSYERACQQGISVITILSVIWVLTHRADFDIITGTQELRAFSLETSFSNFDTDFGQYRLAMQPFIRYILYVCTILYLYMYLYTHLHKALSVFHLSQLGPWASMVSDILYSPDFKTGNLDLAMDLYARAERGYKHVCMTYTMGIATIMRMTNATPYDTTKTNFQAEVRIIWRKDLSSSRRNNAFLPSRVQLLSIQPADDD